MQFKIIAKKSLSIFAVVILILSLNISVNVSAELIPDENYGVAFDDFENDDSIDYVDCKISEGIITLEEGNPVIVYDRKEKPENVEAWTKRDARISPGEGGIKGALSTYFSSPELIMYEKFTDAQHRALEDLEEEDNNVVSTLAVEGGDVDIWPMNLFKFEIDPNIASIKNIKINWRFGKYKD